MMRKETMTLSKQPLIIAVDIDGVLTFETKEWGEEAYRSRTPRPKNIKRVKRLHDQGHKIILFTARHEEDKDVTLEWLSEHKVVYDEIIFNKLHYDFFVDDRALSNFFDLMVTLDRR